MGVFADLDGTTVGVALGAVVLALLLRSVSSKSSIPLPPGPRGWPIIGNMLEVPPVQQWLWLRKLHEKHGPLVSYSVLGNVVVSVGDYELGREILDRKASATSGRPVNHVFDTFVYRDRAVGFQTDTPAMRAGRKIIQPMFADAKNGRTEPGQQFEAAYSMIRMLDNPSSFRDELQRFTTSEATVPLFGVHMPTSDEPFVDRLRVALDSIFVYANPYYSVINMFPWADKFLPSALAPWRKTATDFSNYYTSVGQEAVDFAMESGKKGISSWAYDVKTNETLQKQIAATPLTTEVMAMELVQAASETTWTVMLRFVSAWAIWPDRMKAAQDEIDRVVGADRLPTFEDRPNLPLVEAVCRETMRWRPPVPLGLTHITTEDLQVEVKGKTYLIPKGATLWGNSWEIDAMRKGVADPEAFDPKNQLNDDGNLKPFAGSHTAFGWGRRICAGQPFAERGLYTMVVHMLWAFNCGPGPNGIPDINSTSLGITSVPNPFDVNLTPRSEARTLVAKREWASMEKDLTRLTS